MILKLINTLKKVNGHLVFYTAMAFMLLYSLNFFLDTCLDYQKEFLVIGLLLLFYKTFLTKYTVIQKIFIVVALLFSLLQFWVSGMTYGMIILLVIIASKDIELKKFLEFYIIVGTLVVVGSIFFSLTGIHGNTFLKTEFGETRGVITRYSFGFDGPNRFAVFVIGICSAVVCVWWNRFKEWWPFLILGLVIGILFWFTKSRTGLIAGGFLLVLTLVFQFKVFSNNKMFQYVISEGFQFFILILSFWGAFFPFKGYFWTYTDMFFNARFSGAITLMKGESINLFGAKGLDIYKSIDNSYVAFLYIGGSILFVTYIIGVDLLIRYYIKRKDLGALVVIITFIPICFTTSIMYGIYQNLVLFMFVGTWDKLLPVFMHKKEIIFWGKVKQKISSLMNKIKI